MSAKTYNELRDSVKKFTRRNDIDLILDTMIEAVEDYVYPLLRVREMFDSHAAVLTVGSRVTPLPDNFEEAVPHGCYTTLNGVRYPIEYTLNAIDNRDLSGRPMQFKITDQIEFDVKADSAYAFVFEHFARPNKLTEATGTNSILTAYPSIYLYGVMWQVNEYSKELELADREKSKLDMAIGQANLRFKQSQFGPSPKLHGVQRSSLRYVTMRGH